MLKIIVSKACTKKTMPKLFLWIRFYLQSLQDTTTDMDTRSALNRQTKAPNDLGVEGLE